MSSPWISLGLLPLDHFQSPVKTSTNGFYLMSKNHIYSFDAVEEKFTLIRDFKIDDTLESVILSPMKMNQLICITSYIYGGAPHCYRKKLVGINLKSCEPPEVICDDDFCTQTRADMVCVKDKIHIITERNYTNDRHYLFNPHKNCIEWQHTISPGIYSRCRNLLYLAKEQSILCVGVNKTLRDEKERPLIQKYSLMDDTWTSEDISNPKDLCECTSSILYEKNNKYIFILIGSSVDNNEEYFMYIYDSAKKIFRKSVKCPKGRWFSGVILGDAQKNKLIANGYTKHHFPSEIIDLMAMYIGIEDVLYLLKHGQSFFNNPDQSEYWKISLDYIFKAAHMI